MFVPEHYRSADQRWPLRIVRDNPLGMLITSDGAQAPHTTHLPVILAAPDVERLQQGGAWPDTLLQGHMNRANPHWKVLADGQQARVVFSGPDSYVSPAVYDEWPAAPTWNFVSVHVRGTVRVVEDDEEALGIVSTTAQELENRFGEELALDSAAQYFRRILLGVGAFEVRVHECDAMFKLSQERDRDVRRSVADWCAIRPRGRSNDLATVMRRFHESSEG